MKTKKNEFKLGRFKLFGVAILFLFGFLSGIAYASGSLQLTNLRTEYKTNPVGIDIMQPRLSWEIITSERNFMQTAYQIQAADNENDLKENKNLLWDSGKIQSDQSNQVVYKGPDLKSGQRIYWQGKIWGNKRETSSWSSPAFWEMGLLNVSDWKAEWIEPGIKEDLKKLNPCPMLRHEFEIEKEVKSARAYVTSRGLYECH